MQLLVNVLAWILQPSVLCSKMRVKCSYKAGGLTSQVECTGGHGTQLLGIGSLFLQAKL